MAWKHDCVVENCTVHIIMDPRVGVCTNFLMGNETLCYCDVFAFEVLNVVMNDVQKEVK